MGDELRSQLSIFDMLKMVLVIENASLLSTKYLLDSFLMCSFVCLGFLKRLFNALTSSLKTFEKFVAMLALRLTEGCHGNFAISRAKL